MGKWARHPVNFMVCWPPDLNTTRNFGCKWPFFGQGKINGCICGCTVHVCGVIDRQCFIMPCSSLLVQFDFSQLSQLATLSRQKGAFVVVSSNGDI